MIKHLEPQQLSFDRLLFPGRTVLYVGEVAERLGITEQHVHDLIAEGQIQAVDVGGGTRRFWRIPVEGYEAFLKARHSFRI